MYKAKIHYDVIISPEAERELLESKSFYAEQKDELGFEFLNEVELTINRLSSNPFQFPSHRIKMVRKAKVDRFPFNIFFAIQGNIINILAIFHCSRNQKSLKKRAP